MSIMTDTCLSPHHMQAANERSPCCIMKRKNLFPSDSPQSLGLGCISSLTPSPEVYSPPNWSDSSENNSRQSLVLTEVTFDDILYGAGKLIKPVSRDTDHLKMSLEHMEGEFENELNCVMTPINTNICSEFKEKKTPIGISTFPSNSKLHKNFRSMKELQSEPVVIKPVNFYGNVSSQSVDNQGSHSQQKRMWYPAQQSKVRTKLFLENRSVNEKQDRLHSNESSKRRARNMKEIYTGVHHRILKPKPKKKVLHHTKALRSKIKNEFDFSRTPYVLHKKYKTGWEYPSVITKPERVEAENSEKKRKFFKTTLKESPLFSLSSNPGEQNRKKRKLFNCISDLDNNVSRSGSLNISRSASDIFEITKDGVNEKTIDVEQRHVGDIISHLECEDETGIHKHEIRELIDSFHEIEESEDDENKCPNSGVTNFTASTATLALNSTDRNQGTGFGSSNSYGKTQSDQLFPIFNHSYKFKEVLADMTNKLRPQKKNMMRPIGNDQYQIDAGQKEFGEKLCSECGLLYQQGDPDDEIQHSEYHTNFQTLRFMGWKNENIVGCYGADKVIVVRWNDPKIWHMKCASILAVVDKELGITSECSIIAPDMKVFLYISEKQVIGCLVGISLSRAYKLYESTSDMATCSEESFPVKCGICRLWTHPAYRRRGIASKLVDSLRLNFVYGYILTRDDIAFSVPTPDGKSFATKYLGKSNFYVFTGY